VSKQIKTEELPSGNLRKIAQLGKIWAILSSSERREAMQLLFLMSAVALFEALGVGTILPFVAVAADPAALHGESALGQVYLWSGVESDRHFLLLLGFVVLLVLVAGNALRALSTWRTHRFSQMTGHALALRLLRSYLSRPYEYFLTRHTADLGKNILQEVHQVVNGVIFLALSGLSRLFTAGLLIAILFIADPLLTISSLIILGGAYGIIYALSRGLQARLGRKQVAANHARYFVASEVFAGVKDVKLKGLEEISVDRFALPSAEFGQGQAISLTLSQTPRFFLEVIAFGGVLLMVLYFLLERGGITQALPIISLYAFAGYRLLPAMQEIFTSATRLKFSWPSLELIHREFGGATAPFVSGSVCEPLPFKRSIRLENVSYRYPTSDRPVIKQITLQIPHGARVGFIGSTGSGKSTTVDLILGLLRPTEGLVYIDDTPLVGEEVIRRWQARIGYVPQHISLADDTIAANIAFGEHVDEIDQVAVERAARTAQLHDFIVTELPKGYSTPIGERGVRLSGGQRQRLGLARALYGDPAVLVLDEATSALDNETEAAVMSALDVIAGNTTIIAIAHRLSTIQRADIVFRMEDGRLVASGPSSELAKLNAAANCRPNG